MNKIFRAHRGALGRAKGMRCSFSRATSVCTLTAPYERFFHKKKMKIMYEKFMMSEKCARLFAQECFDRVFARSAAEEERKCVYIFVDTSLGCFKNIYIFLPPVENICLQRRSKFFHTSRVH